MIAYLRDLIIKDFWLKLFSLALAFLVWKFVDAAVKKENQSVPNPIQSARPIDRRTFLHLPVVVISSASDVRTFRVNPSEVEVAIQGDPKLMEAVQARDIRPMVDLTGVESARNLRKRIDVATPPGITYVRVNPKEVEIIFPPRQTE